MNRILIIAAHPDDEDFGCGGTIAKLSDQCVTINVALLVDGVFSHACDSVLHQPELTARRAVAQKAYDVLGVKSLISAISSQPDGHFSSA